MANRIGWRPCVSGVVGLVAVSCGAFGDDISFYGSYEETPGSLVVELSVCTDDDVTATISPGDDCAGVLFVDLDEPLGDRAVVVEGERWVPYEGTCDRQVTLVPPDIPDWFVDCPEGG